MNTSVFAPSVRPSDRRLNGDGALNIERSIRAYMPYAALEDAEAFHAIAEQQRLAMIHALQEVGAPINVWRVGMVGGVVASRIDAITGMEQEWKDSHVFYVRTRASHESQPPKEETL